VRADGPAKPCNYLGLRGNGAIPLRQQDVLGISMPGIKPGGIQVTDAKLTISVSQFTQGHGANYFIE
jgi:hypothetical protein